MSFVQQDIISNGNALAKVILDTPLSMRDAIAYYKALDGTDWRDGTDTYLEVVETNGVVWKVLEVTSREIRPRDLSPLAVRGVHTQYTLVLDSDNTEGVPDSYLPSPTISTREVRPDVRCRISVYNDEISHAIVRPY